MDEEEKQTEYVAYDLTCISSYSSNIRDLEWGYNQDKRRNFLREICGWRIVWGSEY